MLNKLSAGSEGKGYQKKAKRFFLGGGAVLIVQSLNYASADIPIVYIEHIKFLWIMKYFPFNFTFPLASPCPISIYLRVSLLRYSQVS